jgi:uncharacterized C2H2 Zn-finger protein
MTYSNEFPNPTLGPGDRLIKCSKCGTWVQPKKPTKRKSKCPQCDAILPLGKDRKD